MEYSAREPRRWSTCVVLCAAVLELNGCVSPIDIRCDKATDCAWPATCQMGVCVATSHSDTAVGRIEGHVLACSASSGDKVSTNSTYALYGTLGEPTPAIGAGSTQMCNGTYRLMGGFNVLHWRR